MNNLIIACSALLLCCACNKKNATPDNAPSANKDSATPPAVAKAETDSDPSFPEVPLTGKLNGQEFHFNKVIVATNKPYCLWLWQDKKTKIQITLPKLNTSINGKLEGATAYAPPRREKNSPNPYPTPEVEVAGIPQWDRIQAQIEFGKIKAGSIQGRISLSVSNSTDTVIEGTFNAKALNSFEARKEVGL